jgi:hypothetical protein
VFSNSGAQTELERRNGFKDIKLGMIVDSVKGINLKKEFKERDEFDAKLYTVENPAYEKIGEVGVKRVEIKSYKSLVYEISVVAAKDTRLMKALESIYGQAEYNVKNDNYYWKGKSITLTFRSHSRNELEMLYVSSEVHALMKKDKAKKVEAIADDF